MSWATLTGAQAQELAAKHGTPFYFYDLGVLRERVVRAKKALPATLLYGVKANPNVGVVRSLHGLVDGLDVSSLGELELGLRCGFAPEQLSFVGPGKTQHELEQAVARGVLVSVESIRELEAVARLRKGARVRLRLNPLARAQAYRVPMIGGPSPFGIDEEELASAVSRLGDVDFDGIHVHPGGQCTSVGAFTAAAVATLNLAEKVGVPVRTVNFGGGFGVLGPGDELDVEAVGRKLGAMLDKFRTRAPSPCDPCDSGARVGERGPAAVLELGRWLVGPAGLYVARVVSEKRSRGKHFVILDGGMNHHLGATGHLAPGDAPRMPLINLSRPDAAKVVCTVTGPLCTPLDTFGEVELAEPRVGDLIAVTGSGAYGYSFSPLQFLGHALPVEVIR